MATSNEPQAAEAVDLAASPAAGNAKKKWILLIAAGVFGLLLVVGGVGFVFYSLGKKGAPSAAPASVSQTAPMVYVELDPAFVLNITDKDNKVSYVQIGVAFASRDAEAMAGVKKGEALIKNDIINLLSTKSYQELYDETGKKTLSDEIKKVVQKVLQDQGGSSNIENVFFTEFVMQ